MRREIALAAERVERKLAVILAADVAGYSRLMGADEEGTLARLKAHRRELIDPKIAEHRGRIVKTIGDGLLVEFARFEALRASCAQCDTTRARSVMWPLINSCSGLLG
jgi:adenylate cyclase